MVFVDATFRQGNKKSHILVITQPQINFSMVRFGETNGKLTERSIKLILCQCKCKLEVNKV